MNLPSTRWLVLGLSSTLLFGNYYAYDIPASLSTAFAQHFSFTPSQHQYNLNLFYSLYSLPNTVLPFWGGYLVDVYGTAKMVWWLGILVCLGQALVALGVQVKWVWVVWVGRLLFGVGAESLSVAQTRITTKWFRGKDLALALGMNLSVARLGTVFNDLLTPHLAYTISTPFAVWFGLVTCLFSLTCGILLIRLDRIHDSKASPVARTERLSLQIVKSYPLTFWMLCLILCLLYATVIPFNTIHAEFLQNKWYKDDPEKAAQLTSIPDTLSAILVPFIGHFSDTRGHRVKTIILCGILIASIHGYLGLVKGGSSSSPIPALVVLGVSYAMLLTFWPCVAIVIGEEGSATAFGLTTSFLNISLTVFPILVARLTTLDPTFLFTEMFFVFCALGGVFFAVLLFLVDRKLFGGLLEKPEAEAEGDDDMEYTLVERPNGIDGSEEDLEGDVEELWDVGQVGVDVDDAKA
ncbi:uncharacterized protein SPPG_02595 [Spizellomyces punctatus DAOM BR117]|uniref:Lysosomal dipeptide transporter MFSD1 n=1 Tax=Spizellomyces punctatus (strain DAOM BR117) TaxID=645134 RepID=A0A0L0HMG6_SPIPD|nr:uncharacterized protein SPPG_02595 [Spizellomyces punctatus DAOM BR117]KND02095.1 hypothetical protein SPPG_02595 [Spizellomyces punctatus DAOM BR117]|eukprot:XP_016610134.1 hypothetical protein SPPG_02595 [Spizellomyces punctatus DAOM BR117]